MGGTSDRVSFSPGGTSAEVVLLRKARSHVRMVLVFFVLGIFFWAFSTQR